MAYMKLWLDDIRDMPDGYVWHAKTAQEAITIIQNMRVEEISLDHDLGDDENGTGYDVATYIEKCAFYKTISPMRMHIHSANPIGVKRMQTALMNACRYWGVEPNEYLS